MAGPDDDKDDPDEHRTTEIGTDEIRTSELPIEAAVRARVLAGRAAMRALASAVERGDEAAAAESWAAIGLRQQEGFGGAPPEVRRWLAGRAPVRWAELYKWEDPWAAGALWREALLVRLRDDGRRAEGLEMLEEPTLLADLPHDETAAELARRAAPAVAWYSEAGAELLRKLGGAPRTPHLDQLVAQAKLDVELGRHARAAAGTPGMPPLLQRYLIERSLLEGEARRVLIDQLHEDLRGDLPRYLTWAERLFRAQPRFAGALTERMAQHVARGSRGLADLSPSRRERLAEQLRRLSPRPPIALARPAVLLGALGVFLVGTTLPAMQLLALLAAIVVVVSLAIARDHAVYRRRVRRPLLEALIDLELTQRCALETRGGRVAGYGPSLRRDRAAQLLARIGAADPGDG